MRESAIAAQAQGVTCDTWEDLPIEGRLIIESILQRIDAATGCVAEISDTNPNVLFEAGFALGRGKVLYLAIDETDESARSRKPSKFNLRLSGCKAVTVGSRQLGVAVTTSSLNSCGYALGIVGTF